MIKIIILSLLMLIIVQCQTVVVDSDIVKEYGELSGYVNPEWRVNFRSNVEHATIQYKEPDSNEWVSRDLYQKVAERWNYKEGYVLIVDRAKELDSCSYMITVWLSE